MELKTPLYETHVNSGGKIVTFGGYLMPVQYPTGVIAEHMAVRTKCGLFDVSHMGEVTVKGPDALKNLNHLLTNDYTHMDIGQARYSPMCNEHGGTVDDLIVYKKAADDYLVIVNAANKDKDFSWMCSHKFGDVEMMDISAKVGQLALQGPKAQKILEKLLASGGAGAGRTSAGPEVRKIPAEYIPQKYYTAKFGCEVGGIPCIISRTGYTGEDGFEFYMAAGRAVDFWNMLLDAGKEEGLIPCGLGARDTLRLEAGMPLYGHEMTDDISPLVAGLGIFVKMGKDEFIGKEALEKAGKPAERRVGLKVTGRGIIREECDVYDGNQKIGVTTSGTYAPYLKCPVAMAILPAAYKEPGTKVSVDVRGRRVDAEVVKLPFYRRAV